MQTAQERIQARQIAQAKWRTQRGVDWKKKNHRHIRTYDNKYREAKKEQAIQKLGGKCSNPACQWLNADGSRGCIDRRCLQIDHVKGGGNQERKHGVIGWTLWNLVLQDTENKYQLLCANCNWIKKFENKELATLRKY